MDSQIQPNIMDSQIQSNIPITFFSPRPEKKIKREDIIKQDIMSKYIYNNYLESIKES